MSNQLTKADAARKKVNLNSNSLFSALRHGGPCVWLSCIVMGFGNIVAGQFVKGLIFMALEAAILYLIFMPQGCLARITALPALCDNFEERIWLEDYGIWYSYFRDPSWRVLLYGVIGIAIVGILIVIWQASVRSGYLQISKRRAGKHVNNIWEDIKSLFDENIHKLLMMFPFLCIIVFTVVPLIYMVCMAFTNYSVAGSTEMNDTINEFDWVGFDSFKLFFDSGSAIGKQFWDVLAWTMVWAFFATFLNFFLGTFVAMIINRPSTRFKGTWRTIFSLTVAVPQFVSLLLINTMFQDNGIVNLTLQDLGFIEEPILFLSDGRNNGLTPRMFVIIVNLWVGIPYTIMQVTGILKNIPGDLYEAARIDGANAFQQFKSITLPYMIFVMTPYIITSFTGNINNFNVIFLLTGGGPKMPGAEVGKTDLLVTWLYRMSMENPQKYNLAAVIGIFTFIVLATISLVAYRSSGSYKDEEGFR